jgi:hypothetical protein
VAYAISVGGDALQSLARMDLQQRTATHIISHGKSVYDSVVDESLLKIPNMVNEQTTKQPSNGWGRG